MEEFEYIDEVDESVVVEESTIDVPILNRTVSDVDSLFTVCNIISSIWSDSKQFPLDEK